MPSPPLAPEAILFLASHGYVVAGVLGRGGQADTLRVVRPGTGTAYAAKVFDFRNARDWAETKMAAREATALAALVHPGIPRFVAMLDDPNGRFRAIVMELVDGTPLRAFLREHPPKSPDAAWWILADACGALRAIHDAGFTHRDVKPENFLVDQNGHLALLDLGAAGTRSPGNGTTVILGTPGYMAPELQLGGTPASDIYSLGVTFIAAVAGCEPARLPRRGGLSVDVGRALPTASRRLRALLRDMTSMEPAKRPQSVDEVIRALSKLDAVAKSADAAPRARRAPPPPRSAPNAAHQATAPGVARWCPTCAAVTRHATRAPRGGDNPPRLRFACSECGSVRMGIDVTADESARSAGMRQTPVPEKVFRAGIVREPGWDYYIQGQNVMRVGGGDESNSASGMNQLILKTNVSPVPGYLYFLDDDGDVARIDARERPQVGGQPLEAPQEDAGQPRWVDVAEVSLDVGRGWQPALVVTYRAADGSAIGVENVSPADRATFQRWWRSRGGPPPFPGAAHEVVARREELTRHPTRARVWPGLSVDRSLASLLVGGVERAAHSAKRVEQ